MSGTPRPKITARKYEGDDRASWAIFVNNRPVLTGLTKAEIPYYKRQVTKRLEDQSGRYWGGNRRERAANLYHVRVCARVVGQGKESLLEKLTAPLCGLLHRFAYGHE